jgi:hypothetical protein
MTNNGRMPRTLGVQEGDRLSIPLWFGSACLMKRARVEARSKKCRRARQIEEEEFRKSQERI